MRKVLVRGGGITEGHADDLVLHLVQFAEPQMLVEECILDALYRRPEWFAPNLTLTRPDSGHGSTGHGVGEHDECAEVRAGCVCFVNNIVRLDACGRSVIWRVARYHHDDRRTWEMAWPD